MWFRFLLKCGSLIFYFVVLIKLILCHSEMVPPVQTLLRSGVQAQKMAVFPLSGQCPTKPVCTDNSVLQMRMHDWGVSQKIKRANASLWLLPTFTIYILEHWSVCNFRNCPCDVQRRSGCSEMCFRSTKTPPHLTTAEYWPGKHTFPSHCRVIQTDVKCNFLSTKI